jgi:hypothetical protein
MVYCMCIPFYINEKEKNIHCFNVIITTFVSCSSSSISRKYVLSLSNIKFILMAPYFFINNKSVKRYIDMIDLYQIFYGTKSYRYRIKSLFLVGKRGPIYYEVS